MATGLQSDIQMPSRTTSPGLVDSDVDDSSTSSTFSRSRNSNTPISQGELDQDDTDNDFEQPSLDDGSIDEGIIVNSGASSSTSLASSAYEDEVTHGRRYHGFQRGRYPLPNDELEQHREATNHALMLELTQGRLFYSNIGKNPQNIVDIGTGTGTWAIEVADQFPSASVVGTDLSPIQPEFVPPNLRVYIDDCEDPDWVIGSNFDLVHFRDVAGTLRDLDGMLERIYLHVLDGGWVEFHEFIPQILCDDGSMHERDPLKVFIDTSSLGLRKFGGEPLRGLKLDEALVGAGFTNIHTITKKVPIGPWPRDKHLKFIGMCMRTALSQSLGALAAKPMTTLGMPHASRRPASSSHGGKTKPE